MDSKEKIAEYLDERVIEDLDLVEEVIFQNLDSDVELMEEMTQYLLKAGGKRVRPAFVLLAFRAVGGEDIGSVIPIAAAIELIHTATLIHDDINDSSSTRRGLASVNRKYGLSRALVAGDFTFVKAFRIGGAYEWDIVKIIADACSDLAEGEVLQSMNRYNTALTLEEYGRTIGKKTASLISACGAVGAKLGGASEEVVRSMSDYGYNLGMTFQIIDDIIDLEGDDSKTGKTRGSDIREGMMSVPLIRAISVLEPKKREVLTGLILKKDSSHDEIKEAVLLVMETDALAFSRKLAEEYGSKARKALDTLPESDYKENLSMLIDAVMERDY
ncbi:MAG: polyprenyl synthetase family protein [Thermoplasmata archaeon]|nr:MAG: polyprenyl synthetase family protein [Thermoplasmata archaeon]